MLSHKPPTASQKKRLSKLLGQREELILVTSIGTRYFWLHFLALLPLAFLIIGIPKLSRLLRMRQSYTYALSSRRFLIIRGIFSRKIVTAPLTAIMHVTVEQSFIQRFIFNTGHLVVITAGYDQREIVMEHIANPIQFKVLIEELTQKLEGEIGEGEEEDTSEIRALSM